MELDHLCRNRICVNPDHLELVTHAQNLRRGKNVKLTENQVKEIKEIFISRTMKVKDIAAKFKVASCNISNIMAGRKWKNI